MPTLEESLQQSLVLAGVIGTVFVIVTLSDSARAFRGKGNSMEMMIYELV